MGYGIAIASMAMAPHLYKLEGVGYIPTVRINTSVVIRKAIKKFQYMRLFGLIFVKMRMPMDTFRFIYESFNHSIRMPMSRA